MTGQYRLPFLLSLALHAALAGLLLANIAFDRKKVTPKPVPEVIQASMIDESKVLAELEKLKQQEINKKQAEIARQKKLKKEQDREKRQLAELKKKRLKEQKRAKEQTAKNRAKEKAEKARLVKLKKEKEAEKKKLNKLKKEKKLAEKQRETARLKKVETEKKRKVEAARLKKIAEEKKVKALAEKRRKEKLAREQAERERKAALKKQLEEEQREEADKNVTAHYVGLIERRVQNNWLMPLNGESGLKCLLRVRLLPSGEVIDVRVIKSSGNALFDQSVERAARKASPLPVPEDLRLFNKTFRSFAFEFDPSK